MSSKDLEQPRYNLERHGGWPMRHVVTQETACAICMMRSRQFVTLAYLRYALLP